MDAAIQNVENQRVPYFQSVGIEFSKSDPEDVTTASNALLIRYLVHRVRDGRVVFFNQAAAADFSRRHYQETSETVFYDADYWFIALRITERPGQEAISRDLSNGREASRRSIC